MPNDEEPLYYVNHDLTSVITPVKVDKLVNLLQEANYSESEIQFLRNGFSNGFDIGYEGPKDRCSTPENIPFSIRNDVEMWNKIMKEVKHGRVAGPFEEILYKNFIQSPIGLVPKAGGDQTRLNFHLSYNFKTDGLGSLNSYTPRDKCSVKYRDLDYAVGTYIDLCHEILGEQYSESDTKESNSSEEKRVQLSRQSTTDKWREHFHNHRQLQQPIFGGKSDLKSAFRILGLFPGCFQ